MHRRLRRVLLGFVLGYASVYVLYLEDAMHTPQFEALYDGTRPHDAMGWLTLQHASEELFLVAGVAGALLGFVASYVRRR